MQKKKQNQTKPVKQIILFVIAVILLLLIIFAEDIIKLTSKNKTNLAQNPENELISNEPNAPQLSAGMIPVKWDGENWVITTSKDKGWYDYANGKPAYIMLNDGTYQSELIRDMTGKRLASDVVGNDAPVVPPDQLGTIFVWIPRFAINNETNDIKYLNDMESLDENWTISNMFTYAQTSETAPNFLLTGIWIEKDVDNEYATKIAKMNQEESIYGFIKNTIAVSSDQTNQNIIQKYVENLVGADKSRNMQITDITNPNRIILHIINPKKQDPIKAKAYYDETTETIKIEVTYTKNGISEILDEEEKILSKNSLTADTGNKVIENGRYLFTIIDNDGNKKELNIKITGIIPSYYGKVVTNYNCSVEGVTWRVFYKDDSNIYLIADDYIPYNSIPTSTNGTLLNQGNTNYKAYFTKILNDYTGSEWIKINTKENARKWLNKYLNAYPNSTNKNMQAVAYMMDTTKWNSFAGDKAEYAIGGPTIEIFCASYRVTHPNRYIECNSLTSSGYKVKWSDNASYSADISGLIKNDFNSIYIKSENSKANGMWLASPSNNASYILAARCSGSIYCDPYFGNQGAGFRPIICLKSAIKLQNNGDGTYSIK